ncbi:MAG TPA: hypothetical protein QF355_07270, partial [Candidatus Marinimicrobia bacterium]|nr:hypothetical protein [Candidatus Neomarinimicrobiota bacterium]
MLKNNHYSSRKGLLLFITGIFLSVLILMPGSSLYAQQRMDDEVMPKEAGGQQEKVSEPINPTREVKEAAKFFYMQGVKKAKEKDYEGALEDLISAYKLFPDKKIKTQIDKLSSFLDKQTTPDIAEDGESSSAKKAPFIDKVASFFGRKTTPDIAEDGESSSAKKAPFIDKVASFLGIKPILLATGEKEAETYYRE